MKSPVRHVGFIRGSLKTGPAGTGFFKPSLRALPVCRITQERFLVT